MSSKNVENALIQSIPKSSSGIPLFGNTLKFINNPTECALADYKKLGPIFRSSIFFMDITNVVGPDALQMIFTDVDKNFPSAMAMNKFSKGIFANSIIARDFEDHRYHRRIMQSAFKKDPMKSYLSRMTSYVESALNKGSKTPQLLFYPFVKMLSLRLASGIFLGLTDKTQLESIGSSLTTMMDGSLTPIRLNIPGLPYHQALKSKQTIADFIGELIPKRRRNPSTDMLSAFCLAKSEQGEEFSDQEIIDHMLFMWMAAHETVASLLSNLMVHICQIPSWQSRLREECYSIGKPVLEYEDLSKLELMDLVINETLRMQPPGSIAIRSALRECEHQGYKIPANSILLLSLGVSHFLEEFWTEPEKFDPLRFAPDRAEDKNHPYLFLPFGGGAHSCIGKHFAVMEAKTILYQMLINYSWTTPEGYMPTFKMLPIPKPKDGLPIFMRPLPKHAQLH